MFPNFKKLELTDRKDVENITKDFPPYSDFNFVSMWAWNVNETMKLSILNNNLVILFNDYLSDKHYLSFIGKNKINETASELIAFSKETEGHGILKYIPEEVAKNISDSLFKVILNKDNCDYIESIPDLAKLDKLKNNRGRQCRQFLKLFPDFKLKLCTIEEINKNEIKDIFIRWAKNKQLNYYDLVEFKAFEKCLQLKDKNTWILSIYVENIIIGFQMIGFLSNDYVMCEFRKADVNFKGIYPFIEWKSAEILFEMGIKYINIQVDLGINGLRNNKIESNPNFLLHSFNIEKNESYKFFTNISINEKVC